MSLEKKINCCKNSLEFQRTTQKHGIRYCILRNEVLDCRYHKRDIAYRATEGWRTLCTNPRAKPTLFYRTKFFFEDLVYTLKLG